MIPTITKDLFVESINAIEKQLMHDEGYVAAMSSFHKGTRPAPYNNSAIIDQLIKIVQIATNDFGEHSWIDYFIWELDSGKKYRDGCVVIQGNNFELTNAKQLWDLLNMD